MVRINNPHYPLLLSIGPIKGLRAKKIKKALIGLVQDILAKTSV
jgi:hypothetical protein